MSTAQPSAVFSAQAYRDRLFSLVGNQKPLQVMAQTADALGNIVSTHAPSILRRRPFENKWTPNEIIGHLADGEWVYGYRLMLILSEENPTILGTSQEAWVANLRHNEREPANLVETFRVLREANLTTWKRVSPVDLQRTGQHNERGPESLETMQRLLAGHDLSHLAQIRRYIEAILQAGSSD